MKWMRKGKLIKIFLNNFNNQHVIILIVVCFKMESTVNVIFTYMYAYVSKVKINLRKYINNFNLPDEHCNCNMFPKIG